MLIDEGHFAPWICYTKHAHMSYVLIVGQYTYLLNKKCHISRILVLCLRYNIWGLRVDIQRTIIWRDQISMTSCTSYIFDIKLCKIGYIII